MPRCMVESVCSGQLSSPAATLRLTNFEASPGLGQLLGPLRALREQSDIKVKMLTIVDVSLAFALLTTSNESASSSHVEQLVDH